MDDINNLMWGVTVISLISTVANIYKKAWCFYGWGATNICWALYDIHIGAYAQAFLMVTYFGLSVWGLIHWNRKVTDGLDV